jgi:hypothetical protein
VAAAAWKLFVLLGTCCCVLGWIGTLAGPRSLLLFGLLGFAIGGIGRLLTRRIHVAPRSTTTDKLRLVVGKLSTTLVIIFFVCLCLSLLLSFLDGGVADFPALQRRDRYELNSHGHKTPVPRFRYVLNAALFGTCWHAMALTMNLSAFQRRWYGNETP